LVNPSSVFVSVHLWLIFFSIEMMYFDPKHTALVLIDLLRDFFDAEIWPDSVIPKSRQSLVENTNELISSCRSKQIPVIWFKQAFKSDLSDAFPHMRRSGKKYTIAGTPGCEFLAELERRYVERAWEESGRKVKVAAELLGFPNYQNFSDRMKKYGLKR